MISVTSWWWEQAMAPASRPVKELLFTTTAGSTYDYSAYVTRWPTITTKAGYFAPDTLTVEFAARDLPQELGSIVNSLAGTGGATFFGGTWQVRAGYLHPSSGWETYPLFSGKAKSRKAAQGLVAIDVEGVSAFREEVAIGSDVDTPTSGLVVIGGYYDSSFPLWPFTPAGIAWRILTGYGGLSGVTSTSNPDINFAKWSLWNSSFNVVGEYTSPTSYHWSTIFLSQLRGVKTASILKEVFKQGVSISGVQGDGRITFARENGLADGGYSVDAQIPDELILEADYESSKDSRPTRCTATNEYITGEKYCRTATNSYARNAYGLIEEKWDAGTNLTYQHLDLQEYVMMANMALQRVGTDAVMPRKASVKLPFAGMIFDVVDILQLTNSIHNVTSYWWNTLRKRVDLERATVQFEFEERMPKYLHTSTPL